MDQNKVKKLGKGLAALIGTPVAVPAQPGARNTQDKTNITRLQDDRVESGAAPGRAVEDRAGGVGGAGGAGGVGGVSGVGERSGGADAGVGAGQGAAARVAGEVVEASPYVVVRVSEVMANRFQPRQEFDAAGLATLAASIKRDGLMQPLVVRPAPAGGGAAGGGRAAGATWELVAGERRLRAAQMAGLELVPAVVVDVPDMTAAMWAVIENVQRVDLGPVEKSRAYARLARDFKLTQAEIADQVGEDRTAVSHYIRMGELEPEVIELVRVGKLSFGHARVLNSPLVRPGGPRVALAERAVLESLSVRNLEYLVNRRAGESVENARLVEWAPPEKVGALIEHGEDEVSPAQEAAAKRAAEKAEAAQRLFEARAHVRDQEERIGKHLGTKVKIKTSGGGKRGVICVEFFSLDHFEGLVSKMGIKG